MATEQYLPHTPRPEGDRARGRATARGGATRSLDPSVRVACPSTRSRCEDAESPRSPCPAYFALSLEPMRDEDLVRVHSRLFAEFGHGGGRRGLSGSGSSRRRPLDRAQRI